MYLHTVYRYIYIYTYIDTYSFGMDMHVIRLHIHTVHIELWLPIFKPTACTLCLGTLDYPGREGKARKFGRRGSLDGGCNEEDNVRPLERVPYAQVFAFRGMSQPLAVELYCGSFPSLLPGDCIWRVWLVQIQSRTRIQKPWAPNMDPCWNPHIPIDVFVCIYIYTCIP